jgi:hypothetical protein
MIMPITNLFNYFIHYGIFSLKQYITIINNNKSMVKNSNEEFSY